MCISFESKAKLNTFAVRSHKFIRAVDGSMRRCQLLQIMITRRSAGSGVDKSTNKTTIHTASFSVRYQNEKKQGLGITFLGTERC